MSPEPILCACCGGRVGTRRVEVVERDEFFMGDHAREVIVSAGIYCSQACLSTDLASRAECES